MMDTTLLVLLVLVAVWAIFVLGASAMNDALTDFIRNHFPNDNPPRDH